MDVVHPALQKIRRAIRGTAYEDDLWVVGGAVRDELLGIAHENDFDLVTRGSAAELAHLLFEKGLSKLPPVTYERFGTAMVRIGGTNVELVTARRESYHDDSRKPIVEGASIEEDAARRDFTVNTLMRSVSNGQLLDPLGTGLRDLHEGVLRTPLDPHLTFHDDPLRMLRAIRFRWKLGFDPAPGLFEAIRESRDRLRIVSSERIRDELVKMLLVPSAADALDDLMGLGLIPVFAPEMVPMVGCEQGKWHHLDVWNHTLLVVRNVGSGNLNLTLAALLHDIGKPQTRTVDDNGDTRFFSHEVVGSEISRVLLRRLKFSNDQVEEVARLVRNHMRLGSFSQFTPSAARRLLRDMGDQTDELLTLVQADAESLKPGVKVFDAEPIRARLDDVRRATPIAKLQSPLTGQEIMQILSLKPGPEIGRLKSILTEMVLEGTLQPDDRAGATLVLRQIYGSEKNF
jgi:poly(A) polymerase